MHILYMKEKNKKVEIEKLKKEIANMVKDEENKEFKEKVIEYLNKIRIPKRDKEKEELIERLALVKYLMKIYKVISRYEKYFSSK